MDLSLTESQKLLQQTVRDFMEREAGKSEIVALLGSETGCRPEMIQTAANLGWLGMLIPEQYGGAGASFTDAAVLFEELGRGPLGGPFFSSGVLSALTIIEAAGEAQQAALLPDIAYGRRLYTVALNEPHNSWGPKGVQLRPERTGSGYRLSGVKLFVADAVMATDLIVAARTGPADADVSLLLVNRDHPGVTARNLPGFLSWEAEVKFDNVEVPASNVLGAENGGWAALERAMDKAMPILAAYQVGGCQAVFDMSVTYSQTRHQFGQPIGRFQRVQDMVIKLVNHLDEARWITWETLWKMDTGRPAKAGAHMAKAVASASYLEACNAAHEVHAGMGSAIEYGLVPHTRMSRTLLNYLGNPTWHKRRMAYALGW